MRWAVLLSVAGTACGGKPAPDTKPDAEQAMQRPEAPPTIATGELPDGLLGYAVIPRPKQTLANLSAFTAAVDDDDFAYETDAADALLGGLLQRPPLTGIDYDQPVYALMFDPQAYAQPFAIIATTADGVTVLADETRALAEQAKPLLVAGPHAPRPTVTFLGGPLRARYGAELAGALDGAIADFESESTMGKGPILIARSLQRAFDQSELATLSLELDGTRITLVAGLFGAEGSGLARFAAAQRPSSYSLVSHLDAGNAPMVLAGQMQWSAMEDEIMALTEMTMPALATNREARAKQRDLIGLFSGEVAFVMALSGGFSVTTALEVSNPERARTLMREQTDLFAGDDLWYRYEAVGRPAFRHGKAEVDEYAINYDLEKLPEAQRAAAERILGTSASHFQAVVGDVVVTTGGADARASMQRAIDSLRATRRDDLSPAVAASRERRESLLIHLNLGLMEQLAGPGAAATGAEPMLAAGIGFTERGVLVRLSMSAEDIRALNEQSDAAEEELVQAIDALADEACACTDMPCAERVQAKLMDLIKDAAEPSLENQERIMRIMERMGGCLAKIAPAEPPAE